METKTPKEELKFQEDLNVLTDKIAKLFIDKDRSINDIESFIMKFIFSFEYLGYYTTLGVLEECKNRYREVMNEEELNEYEEEEE